MKCQRFYSVLCLCFISNCVVIINLIGHSNILDLYSKIILSHLVSMTHRHLFDKRTRANEAERVAGNVWQTLHLHIVHYVKCLYEVSHFIPSK